MATRERFASRDIARHRSLKQVLMCTVVDEADANALGCQPEIAHEMVEKLLPEFDQPGRATLAHENFVEGLVMIRPFVQPVASLGVGLRHVPKCASQVCRPPVAA